VERDRGRRNGLGDAASVNSQGKPCPLVTGRLGSFELVHVRGELRERQQARLVLKRMFELVQVRVGR
jgi:hypothetical protein